MKFSGHTISKVAGSKKLLLLKFSQSFYRLKKAGIVKRGIYLSGAEIRVRQIPWTGQTGQTGKTPRQYDFQSLLPGLLRALKWHKPGVSSFIRLEVFFFKVMNLFLSVGANFDFKTYIEYIYFTISLYFWTT